MPSNGSSERIVAATAVLLLTLMVGVTPALAQSAADQRVEQLEKELAEIRQELAALKADVGAQDDPAEEDAVSGTDDRFAELERKIDILAQELEKKEMGSGVFQKPEKSEYGLGIAASKVYQVEQGLSIGGYGEILFEGFASERDDGTPSSETNELDFLRTILYFGYKFNDRWVFNSEIEVEHAATGEEGDVALEFATFDYLWKPELNVRAGLLLLPIGFVNELHEPPLFLGARRPDVERGIIPTTWRENGFGLFGDVGPFSYRTYLVNGLDASGFSSGGIRGGRQKGSKAKAEDFAWTGRLDYTGTPGLLAGVSFYRGGSGQDLTDSTGRGIDATTTLFEGHLEWKYRGFELRALGVSAEIDDVARLNEALGLSGSASIGEELEGFYLQLGYDVLASAASGQKALIPYVRLESFDTQHRVPGGFTKNAARDVDLLTVGLAFKPLDQLTIKADFQDFDNEAGTGLDQFNVAIGYLF